MEHDAPVRMKSECGMYRARFLGAQGKNLHYQEMEFPPLIASLAPRDIESEAATARE